MATQAAHHNGNCQGNGHCEHEANDSRSYKEILGVVERNEPSYWSRIGVAFENHDGSWSLQFDYMPTCPEVRRQLREPRSGSDGAGRGSKRLHSAPCCYPCCVGFFDTGNWASA